MTRHCTWRRCLRGTLTTACLLATSVQLVYSQQLRGRVFESDGATPAAQAGVVVRDSLGRPVWQGHTTTAGSFLARLPAAGTYTVSLLRVGFTPTLSGSFIVTRGGERYVELHLSGAHVSLPVVTVRSRARCPSDPQFSGPLVDAWEQARAGLLAVKARDDATVPGVEVMSYAVVQQLLPRAETLVVVDDIRTQRGESFRSRATTQLIRDGFVVAHGDSIEYHAPDQRVLLDPDFIEHYCLWLEPAPVEEPTLIGIGLRPAGTSNADRGVEGVLWVRSDGSLVRFDFHYRGTTAVLAAARPGGTLRFRRLDDGRSIVASWQIRMPQAVIERKMSAAWSNAPPQMVSRLQRVVTKGGVATRFASTEGRWTPLETVSVGIRVNAEGGEQRLTGSTVRPVLDTSGWIVSESLQLPPQSLVPGNHRFLVQSPLMRDAGLAAVEVTVPVLPDSQFGPPMLLIPSVAAVRRMLCEADTLNRPGAAAYGTVPPALLSRDSTWSFWLADALADDGRRNRVRTGRAVRVGRDGRWAVCGLPRDVPLVLSLHHDGRRSEIQRFRIPKGVSLAAVANPGELPWSTAESSESATRTLGGALDLHVRAASDGSVLTDADVRIDDTLRVRFIVGAGTYRLHGLSSGLHRVSVRRLGFSPMLKAVILEDGATLSDTVRLARTATRLAEIVINGRRVSYPQRFVDVVQRARAHSGALFTREDLRPVRDVKSLLAMLPGVRVNSRGVTFARCETPLPSRFSGAAATNNVQVYIDGVRVTAMSADTLPVEDALALVSPAAVELVEVYSGVARIPAEWQRDACAVIAIWTKRW